METSLQELFDSLKANWNEFETEHSTFTAKGNKAAAARARKAIQLLKSGITAYKQASVAETKKK
jgi:hypothetical protein